MSESKALHRKFPPNATPTCPPLSTVPAPSTARGKLWLFTTSLAEGAAVVINWVKFQICPSYQDEFSINELPYKCCFLPVPFLHVDKFASIQCHSRLWKEGGGLRCDPGQG